MPKTNEPDPTVPDPAPLDEEAIVHSELARIALSARPAIKYDPNGIVTFCNEAMAMLLGTRSEALVGVRYDAIVPKCSRPFDGIWSKVRDGEFWSGDYGFQTPDGEHRAVVAQYYPLSHEGELVTVVHFMTDVTREEREKADAQGRIRAIWRAQAVVEFDLDGQVVDANDNFLAVMGYARDEVIGQHHRMFVEPSYAASPAYAAFWDGLRRGELRSDQFERVGKNGRRVQIQASYNPITDAQGRVVKVLKFATDVTQRAQDARALADGVAALMRFSEEMSTLSSKMASSASDTADQASASAEASRQVNENVTTVASAVEQMKASVREIASNANHAVAVAQKAADCLRDVTKEVTRLSESSSQIGSIVKVVKAIAEQTNLLALNATIEAARAGAAGKGFAVVASEVKQLAQQTSAATENISTWIDGIQTSTKSTSASVTEVDGVVKQILETQSHIASAVEEQTSTNNEISRALHEAASGVAQISESVTFVASAAQSSSLTAIETSDAAQRLSTMADELRPLVERSVQRTNANKRASAPTRSTPSADRSAFA